MNTKWLMRATSIVLGAVGLLLLFAPELLLQALGTQGIPPLQLLVQMVAALYIAFATMNWMARESVIGGIYNRPLSLANFAHFFIGALFLIRYLLANSAPIWMVIATGLYAIFAALFAWLVFKHSGLTASE